MVLGQKDYPGADRSQFDGPGDVAFGKSGEGYVADGENNSRIVKFDRDGHFLKEWVRRGRRRRIPAGAHHGYGCAGPRLYRRSGHARIQVFDADGKFQTQRQNVGHPYGIFMAPDQHLYVADAEASHFSEMDLRGNILGSFGRAGRGPGQFAAVHSVAVTPTKEIFVAEVFNWRVEKFVP